MSLVVLLGAGMILIVLSADYFTNGVEWLGYRLDLGEGVSGSLLAALGTALPETLVPLMAFIAGSTGQTEAIGLGAVLGAPFMLATLGFSIIGLGVWASGRRQEGLKVSPRALLGDLRFFLVSFGMAILAAFLPRFTHPWVALVLVLYYVFHAWQLLRGSHTDDRPSAPEQPLHLSSRGRPPILLIVLQVGVALLGLIVGAHFFVTALERVTGWVRISGFLISVIVTPLATELPEVLNSIIWIRRKKDSLAVGNVTGAMAFQASLVPAMGLMLTPWHLTTLQAITALLAWLAGLWTLTRSRDGILRISELLGAGLFYVLFILLMIAI